MKTIENGVTNEIIIKNSRFICYLKNVSDEIEIKNFLQEIRNKYKDATHITYAYRTLEKQKYSDDGEPGGTAGAPIMEVLLKNDLVNVIAIVIRYFGGVKLGAGGLIRAYSKATREALIRVDILEYTEYNYYELSTCFDNLKLLNTLTKTFDVIRKNFKNEVMYEIKIKKEEEISFIKIFESTNIKIKKLK